MHGKDERHLAEPWRFSTRDYLESAFRGLWAAQVAFLVTLALTPRRGSPAEIKIALFAASLGHTSAPTKLGVRMGDVISDVEVEVVAVLGRTASTVRALLALERGAVLRLDGAPDRPIEVRVDGVTVLRGMPVVKDGNLAIEVNP